MYVCNEQTILNAPTLMSFCPSKTDTLSTQVTRADIIFCGHVTKRNLLLSTANTLTKTEVEVFPDSKTAASLKCGRSKDTAVVKDVTAMSLSSLAEWMRKHPFTFQQMAAVMPVDSIYPLVVTFKGDGGFVNAELLAFQKVLVVHWMW